MLDCRLDDRTRPGAEVDGSQGQAVQAQDQAALTTRCSVPRPGSLGAKLLEVRKLDGAARRHGEAEFVRGARGFVCRMVRFWVRDDVDRRDLEQDATVGLLVAMRTWDPALSPSFAHFAMWKVRGELARQVRASKLVRGVDAFRFEELEA